MTDLERIKRLEKTLLLALSILAGDDAEDSAEEKDFSRRQLAQWISEMRKDHNG